MAESFLRQFNDPLGIREKSSRPETFEQTVEGEGEDDVAALQTRSFSGKDQLARSYGEERRLIGKQEGLEQRIAADTANLVSYRNDQELFNAQQKQLAAKLDSENITKMLDEIRSSPLYKQKEETNKQIAEYSAFVPTEVTAPMLGVLFAAIGATGMLLGGNSKNTAKAALSAMNGMAEGFGKGREQYDKERKTAFDTNVKLLQTKLSAINDGLEEARKEAVLNKQAAELKVRETLAANDAQFLQTNTDRRGLESTIELVKGQLKSLEKALGLQATKTRQIEGELNRNTQALENRKIIAAHAEATQRAAAEARAEEARIRAKERQAELQQKQKKLTPVGMQGNNIVMADELGNITLVPTGKGFDPKAALQSKAVPGAAAAAKEAAKTSGVTGIVKDALGKDMPGLEAETLVNTARTIQTAKELQSEIKNNPDFVGRQGQLGNFISRYVDAAINGKPTPQDDPNLNQASLRWAKKYAVYLLEFERTLAGGQKGFTVFLQKRFNDLLSQNQFNAEGMVGVLQDQMDEAARLASYKTNYATPENLRKISERAKEIQMGFGVQPATPSKTTSGATVSNW